MACVGNGARDKLEAILGKSIETDIYVQLHQMQGLFKARLKGENGWLSFDAQIKNNILNLNSPFQMEVSVSPKLGKLLEDVVPLLGGAVAGQHPIKITISPDDFSLPLQGLDISAIRVGKATLELGRMTFSNDSELANILSLLRQSNNELLTVWFTPLFVHLKEGKLTVERMDMLILDRYALAIWGKINFLKEFVDMRVGMSAAALGYAFNVKGLGKDYMMQLPFTGRLGEAGIDKGKATARITSLIAQTQGGAQGLLIGAVLGIAGGSLGEESAPAPTINRLPWDTGSETADAADTASADTQKQHKSHHNHRNKSEKLESAASSILQDLFK
jgi:hypothetical protein